MHIPLRKLVPARIMVGICLLVIQCGLIAAARFSEARYFCWAPHDAQNEFELTVTVSDRALSDEEITARYRIGPTGLDPRSIQHIKDHIRRYEETYGRDNPAVVTMDFTTNGIPQEPWHWPPR